MFIDDKSLDVLLAKAGLVLLFGVAAMAYLVRLAATVGHGGARQRAASDAPLTDPTRGNSRDR